MVSRPSVVLKFIRRVMVYSMFSANFIGFLFVALDEAAFPKKKGIP